jgi:iron complex outermembrane receptor protein/vitamin B12 transporter
MIFAFAGALMRATNPLLQRPSFTIPRRIFISALFLLFIQPMHAVVVRGKVTDSLGAAVVNARVELMQGKRVVNFTMTGADGRYELTSGAQGRFALLVVATSFRATFGGDFYSGTLDIVERNIALLPAVAAQQIVVTATGEPTPAAQISSAASVIPGEDFATRNTILDELRLVPGLDVVQTGQNGGLTSLFIRGGNSTANAVLFDGVPAENIGGYFDYGPISTTGIAQVEEYRGADSVLYGSDASAGVISFSTPKGITPRPIFDYTGQAGNFHTWSNEANIGGAIQKLDYYAAASRLDSSNALPMDEFHVATLAGNIGYQIKGGLVMRSTAHYGVSATGLPGAWDFYAIPNDSKESDQNLFLSDSIDYQTTYKWHNVFRYGATRRREQTNQWYAAGILEHDPFGPDYYGKPVIIRGANGYTVSGQAILTYGGSTYPEPSNSVSNRDLGQYQTDYHFTQHITGLFLFRAEDERGTYNFPEYFEFESTDRRNYDVDAALNGDFKNRLFYSLGGGVEKNHLFGVQTGPRLGVAWYPFRPGAGLVQGTKLRANFSKGVQEPDLNSQFFSLDAFLLQQGIPSATVSQYHVAPIGAETSRSYDAGVEQSLLSERVLLKADYFHNEFGNQIEFISANQIGTLFPSVPSADITTLNNTNGGAEANTLSYSAQGVELEGEWHASQRWFVRGGYTHLAALVQHSFSGDASCPTCNENPVLPGIEIGASSPLIGARPFRRPPDIGYVAVTYTRKKWAAAIKGAFDSRSDDSTFLAYADINDGNTLLLPNKNLDYGYQKIDGDVTWNFYKHLQLFAQLNNLLSEQRIGPIGYPALPFNFNAGLKLQLGAQ